MLGVGANANAIATDQPIEKQTTPLTGAVEQMSKTRNERIPSEKAKDDASDARLLNALIDADADVNYVDKKEAFPLIVAAEGKRGTAEIVQLLLKAKANPNLARPSDGAFPLFQAAQDGYAGRVHALLMVSTFIYNPNICCR